MKNLNSTISYFIDLSKTDFELLIPYFKNDIIDIAKNYSKFDLNRMLRGPITRKYDKDNLITLKLIFKERLNEKYFFES